MFLCYQSTEYKLTECSPKNSSLNVHPVKENRTLKMLLIPVYLTEVSCSWSENLTGGLVCLCERPKGVSFLDSSEFGSSTCVWSTVGGCLHHFPFHHCPAQNV